MEKLRMPEREFEKDVLEHILEYLPPEYATASVEIVPSLRPTGESQLRIRPEHVDGWTIYPIISLESYNSTNNTAGMEQEDVLQAIADRYLNEIRQMPAEMEGVLNDFTMARPRIRSLLLSKETRAEYISRYVSVPVGDTDLAMTYYVDVSDIIDQSTATLKIGISQELLDNWGVSIEEIQAAAIEGDRTRNIKLFPMVNLLQEMLSEAVEIKPMDLGESIPMYILITDSKGSTNAASAFLHPDLSAELHRKFEKNGGYYVLPSSIHEVLLLPADSITIPEELAAIVQGVNEECVSLEDKLSDHVYFVDTNDKIAIAA